MPGVNARDAKLLKGWGHVVQSIRKIMTTAIGTRVMRREFGSELMSLVDAPMTDRVVLAVYVATANALARWEPRYQLTHVSVVETSASGLLRLVVVGRYYPRGHLGDFTIFEDGLSSDVAVSIAA